MNKQTEARNIALWMYEKKGSKQGSLKEWSNNHCLAEIVIPTSVYKEHKHSRWYTSDTNVATIDI